MFCERQAPLNLSQDFFLLAPVGHLSSDFQPVQMGILHVKKGVTSGRHVTKLSHFGYMDFA
jgi:hypothetical protein